jgi:hypothetical protein
MNLQEVDTIQDLRDWVAEHMTGAEVRVDMHGTVVIHTHLMDTAGGYLYPKEDASND